MVNFMKGLGRCYKRERERAMSENLSVNDDETCKQTKCLSSRISKMWHSVVEQMQGELQTYPWAFIGV